MNGIQLADLLPIYPTVDEPKFQAKISAKKEFKDLASSVSEPPPSKRGEFYKHQLLIQRYMREYDDLLMIHRTGTGKTCAIVAAAEWFKANRRKGGNIRRIIIIVRGDTLKAEFKQQLVCKCTPEGEYDTPLVNQASDMAHQKGNVTREVKKWYKVTTYQSFAQNLAETYPKPEDNKRMAEDYSDTMFVIDEAHNLRIEPITKDTEQREREKREKRARKRGYALDPSKERLSLDKEGIYQQLWRVLHVARRSKRILATATPMVNDVNELGPLMNLILPLNEFDANGQIVKQNQIPPNFDFSTATLEQVEPYFRGRISYIRELDTGAQVEYVGTPDNGEYSNGDRTYRSQLILDLGIMSDVQEEGYRLTIPGTNNKRSDFFEAQRQASNFVFPDKTWGTEGFRKYVIAEGKADVYRSSPDLAPWLQGIDYIKTLSCKFGAIAEIETTSEGIAFVYSPFVHGGGAILLGLVLEGLGFEKFVENASIFTSSGDTQIRAFCAPNRGSVNRRILRPEFRTPKKRYCLLTSETSDARFTAMMEAVSSPENVNGDIIKVFISTPVGREGTNVNNVRRIHIVGPEWTESALYQARSRALRATSHVDLLAQEVDKLVATGMDRFAAEERATVKVKIYNHAARAIDPQLPSIDFQMYHHTEAKDRDIKRVERLMKQCAVDCQIHHTRNVRSTDVDGSAICDYQQCDYRCVDDPPLTEEDYTSYDVLYSGDIIALIIDRLKELFSQRSTYAVPQLIAILDTFRSKFVVMALYRLINEKLPIIDRFGYTAYVREDRGTIYTQRDFPLNSPMSADAYYVNGIIALTSQRLDEINVALQRTEQQSRLRDLEKLDPTSPTFGQTIDSLILSAQADLLEDVMLRSLRGENSPFIAAVLQHFNGEYFILYEPRTEMARRNDEISQRGMGPGRKPNEENLYKLDDTVPPVYDDSGDAVYLHTVYQKVKTRTAYAVTSRYGKGEGRIRFLKPAEGSNIGWRDLNPFESEVYRIIIMDRRKSAVTQFEDLGIYGSVFKSDNKFRIHNKLGESAKAATDDRSKNRGKKCESWHMNDLVDVMWNVQMALPYGTRQESSRANMMQTIINNPLNKKTYNELTAFDDDRLIYYYSYWTSGMKRNPMCDHIQREMQRLGRMMPA